MRWTAVGWLLGGLSLVLSTAPSEARDPATARAKPKLTVQLGHGDVVQGVAFSPDGRFLLTGSMDKTACLWELSTGRELRRFEGHDGGVTSVAFARDGAHVVTGSWDKTARLWDVATGREVKRFAGHGNFVNAVAISPDGTRVVTGARDHRIRVFDATNQKEISNLPGHQAPVTALAFHPSGQHFVSASEDGTARLWDANAGRELKRYAGKDRIQAVAVSADGKFVLTGGDDKCARLWALDGGQMLREFKGHEKAIRSVAFARDPSYVITGSADQSARIFEIRSGKEQRRFAGHEKWVYGVAASPDGRYVATGSRNARLWDIRTQRERMRLQGEGGRVTSLAPSPNGWHLITGSENEAAHLWDLRLGREVGRFLGHAGGVKAVAFAPNGAWFGNACGDGVAHVVDVRTGKELHELGPHEGHVHTMAFSPDGEHALTAGNDMIVRLWSTKSGTLLRELRGHEREIKAAAFSASGAYCVTGSDDKTARVWDVRSGKELRKFAHEHPVHDCLFTPDGKTVIAASGWGATQWDVRGGSARARLEGHLGWTTSLAVSADGAWLLTGSRDRSTVQWNLKSGKEVRRYRGHGAPVEAVAFLRGDKFIATGSADMTTRIWNAQTGAPVATLASLRDQTWAVVAPDGRFDASNGGAVEGLHWVVGNETMALEQFKVQYYEPGLLGKLLGLNPEPLRAVAALGSAPLYPAVQTRLDGGTLAIRLLDRGGGIGRVVIRVNGKERTADARGGPAGDKGELEIVNDLSDDPRLVPGATNRVEVRAYNKDGTLFSRGLQVEVKKDGKTPPPTLWGIVAGVSDYAGDDLKLRFAAKDARTFAKSLAAASKSLFGEGSTHVTTLPDTTRAQFLEAVNQVAAKAKSSDILVVFLAGHGVTHGDAFYYLTREAATADMSDESQRSTIALSGSEISEAINGINALKQVLILDTCASAKIVDALSGRAVVPSSQGRALDRVKDRTGMFVLTGCAADKVSYEAPGYDHGLLTYSLLLGMSGAKLHEDEFVDVALLFRFAENRVPTFAKDLGGIQRPFVHAPSGRSFFIGRVPPDARRSDLRQVRPQFIAATLQDADEGDDVLDLVRRVNGALTDLSAGKKAPIAYFGDAKLAGAYRIAGNYTTKDGTTRVRFKLRRDKQTVGGDDWITVEGAVDTLAKAIVAEALKRLPKDR